MFHRLASRARKPAPGTVIALAALTAALTGVAYAAIPAADGTIKGCYATTNGILLGIPHSKGELRTVTQPRHAATTRRS